MKKTMFRDARNGRGGIVNPGDNDNLNVIQEDCVAELHDPKLLKGARHHFLAIDCTVTLRCHGTATFTGGQKEIEITGDGIHSVLSLGDKWLPLFEVPKPKRSHKKIVHEDEVPQPQA